MNRSTIVQVVGSSTFAGIERHVLHLSEELTRLGYTVKLACPADASRLRRAATEAGVQLLGSRFPGGTWMELARELHRRRPRAVQVHDGRSALFVTLASRGSAARLVRTQHFIRPASAERSQWQRHASLALHRQINRHMWGYIAVSQAVLDAARARGEIGDLELAVIPPAIELPTDTALSEAVGARSRLAAPVVASLGRLQPERRFEILIRAIPAILRAVPATRFLVGGAGPAEARLRDLAGELGVSSAIDWLGWLDDPSTVLSRAHVYVNTWPDEAFGMAMAEAMGLGLPVVAPDAGASPELVENGRTGIVVPPCDPDALAEAVTGLLLDLPTAAEMGANGRALALQRLGGRRTAQMTAQLLERVAVSAT